MNGRQLVTTLIRQGGIYGLTAEKFSLGRSNPDVVRAMLDAGVRIVRYREKTKKMGAKYEECLALRAMNERTMYAASEEAREEAKRVIYTKASVALLAAMIAAGVLTATLVATPLNSLVVLENGPITYPERQPKDNIFQANGRWETWSSPSSSAFPRCWKTG